MGALGLSGIGISAANGKVAGASATERFNNGGQRENRTWSYPMLRFLIVVELSGKQAIDNSVAEKSYGAPNQFGGAKNLRHKWSRIPRAAPRVPRKVAAFHNRPSRFTAWRLFVSRALNAQHSLELARVLMRFDDVAR